LLRGVRAEVVQSTWRLDPDGARRMLASLAPTVIVVDSYAASATFLASLRVVAPVVAVDDMADRPLPVDVVVNGGAGAEALPDDRRPDTSYLLGPRYALLDPAYAALPGRATAERVRRVFISLGASGQVEATVIALAAVDRALDKCVVDLAIGTLGAGAWELD